MARGVGSLFPPPPMDRYQETARVIEAVERHKTGLKNAVFSGQARNKRAVYALGAETLRHRAILDELLQASGFWDKVCSRKLRPVRCAGALTA